MLLLTGIFSCPVARGADERQSNPDGGLCGTDAAEASNVALAFGVVWLAALEQRQADRFVEARSLHPHKLPDPIIVSDCRDA